MLKRYKSLGIFFVLVLSFFANTARAQIIAVDYLDLGDKITAAPSGAVIFVPNSLTMPSVPSITISKDITLETLNGLAMAFDSVSTNAFFIIGSGSNLNIAGPLTMQNGGQALNNSGTVSILTSGLIGFSGHTGLGSGGAIYNNTGGAINIGSAASTVSFTDNSALYGGAIANYYGSDITIDGTSINFTGNIGGRDGGAIYNYNNSTITIGSALSEVNFINNHAAGYYSGGGAIVNEGSLLNINGISINFDQNTTNQYGGAVYNYADGTINIGSADSAVSFTDNDAGWDGGAIYNAGDLDIYGSSINFTGNGNTTEYGGVIYNSSSAGMTIGAANSVVFFTDNNASVYGGTIYNDGTLNIYGSTLDFAGNTAEHGGAVYNDDHGTVNIGSADSIVSFTNNDSIGGHGGAVYSGGTLVINGSAVDFTGNTAAHGGAVYNNTGGTMTIGSADSILNFEGNNVSNHGGAIFNAGTLSVDGSADFTDNTGSVGGAIYNSGAGAILNLNATAGDITFTDNKAAGVSNAIYNEGTVNLNAFFAHQIVFNDRITGTGTVNINGAFSSGIIVFNEDMTGYTGTLNINAGTLKLGSDGMLPTGSVFNMYASSTLDLLNGNIDDIAIGNFNLLGDPFVKLDVDLATETADNFIGTVLQSGAGPLVINELLLWSDMLDLSSIVIIPIADDPALQAALTLDPSQSIAYGPLYKYNASYSGGDLIFGYRGINPERFIPQVSAQTGGYMTQLNSYAQGFEVLGNDYERECPGCGLWVRPYGYKEDIDFKSGPKVSNTAWGAFIGFDTKPVDIGGGFENNYSFYAGYNNNTSKYEDIRIEQEGILAGITAAFYKGQFFSGITLNAGAARNKATSIHGREEFDMYTAGASVRAGYKIPLNGAQTITLQPIMNAAYSFINVEDYTNAAGLKMTSKNLMPLTVAPELKAQADLINRWTLYAGGSYVWSFMDDNASFMTGGVDIPQISIGPYVQYGVGVFKGFGEHLKIGLEGYGRSLGREGYGGQATLRWNFGKCAKEAPVAAPVIAHEPAPAPAVIAEPKMEIAKSIKVSGENFETNSYQISPDFKNYLRGTAAALKEIGYNKIEITGHTDNTGSASYNILLSEQRAKAIADVFISEGIPAEKISYSGRGAAAPIATNETREGRAENRRVEISIQ